MSDKVKNWYDHLDNKLKRETKLDKNFKKHHILPNSMICCIGGTGSGKTNALVDWLSRKNDAFYNIIIFTGSTSDEPLYSMLKQKMPDIELYNDINELPELKDLFQECVVFDYRTGYCHVRVLSYVIFNLSLSKEKKNISYKMHHKLGGL